MSWSTIWELVKINILYSNPQSMTQIKKKRERNPNKTYSSYKAVIRQQLLLIVVFTFIFLFNFATVNFKDYPGLFSQYVASFFVMAVFYGFSAMYSIFYDSKDLVLYAPLPIRQSEIYVAKVISSLGMGGMFLVPMLALFGIAYWEIIGPLGIILALCNFLLLFASCITLSLVINHLIGRLAVRSARRKLFSSLLMVITTVAWLAIWIFLNFSSTHYEVGSSRSDSSLWPYFRGFYDIAVRPFSLESLLNFYLPIVLVLLLLLGLVKVMVPRFYQETLYSGAIQASSRKKKAYQDRSLTKLLVRHHLATLQNGPLIIQTYLLPLLYPLMLLVPMMISGKGPLRHIPLTFFGVVWLAGMIVGLMSVNPTSFIGVALSLEKEDYFMFRALPLNFKAFARQKYLVLAAVQVCLPAFVLLVVSLLAGLSPGLLLSFLAAYLLTAFVVGQIFYSRDYRLLVLNWQDITQLFQRGGGQILVATLIFGAILLGIPLVFIAYILAQYTNPAIVSLILVIIGLGLLGIVQLIMNRRFWKNLA
ncbi:hypothetical protein ACVR1G_03655 [Streptococcus dentasini]